MNLFKQVSFSFSLTFPLFCHATVYNGPRCDNGWILNSRGTSTCEYQPVSMTSISMAHTGVCSVNPALGNNSGYIQCYGTCTTRYGAPSSIATCATGQTPLVTQSCPKVADATYACSKQTEEVCDLTDPDLILEIAEVCTGDPETIPTPINVPAAPSNYSKQYQCCTPNEPLVPPEFWNDEVGPATGVEKNMPGLRR